MTSPSGGRLGPYELHEVIGKGGMATVYRAHQPSMDRDVAIKIISPELAAEPEFAERFEREALLANIAAGDIDIVVTDAGGIPIAAGNGGELSLALTSARDVYVETNAQSLQNADFVITPALLAYSVATSGSTPGCPGTRTAWPPPPHAGARPPGQQTPASGPAGRCTAPATVGRRR